MTCLTGFALPKCMQGTPLAVAGKEESEIHHTIAELMILANSAVAEKIEATFPSAALVRVHTPPDPARLTAFEGVAEKVGVKNPSSNGQGGGAKGDSSRSRNQCLDCLVGLRGPVVYGRCFACFRCWWRCFRFSPHFLPRRISV